MLDVGTWREAVPYYRVRTETAAVQIIELPYGSLLDVIMETHLRKPWKKTFFSIIKINFEGQILIRGQILFIN